MKETGRFILSVLDMNFLEQKYPRQKFIHFEYRHISKRNEHNNLLAHSESISRIGGKVMLLSKSPGSFNSVD